MSRREGRDSDSKRRHSRFDREPSPKRSRRDGKQERERDRATSGANLDSGDHVDRDQKRPHRLNDALPLEAPLAHDSEQEAGANNKNPDRKLNGHNEGPKHSSDPTEVPKSRYYFQHDDRRSARQPSRRVIGERGWWKDSKDQHDEKVERNISREQRDEKLHAKLDDNTFQRKDSFSERKDDPPPTTKKRPAFREKKILVDTGDGNPAAAVTAKSSQGQGDRPLERNERRQERSSNPHSLDRHEKQYAQDRGPNKGEARRDGFSSRGRYGGSGGNNNYRERDRFGGRQGYLPSKTRIDKWKHDLYEDVNNEPVPKNDDEQIAKLEALLAT
ncbi:hypothetical protein L6164_035777 [Bauhinia variegata]|uniref:Uncharacterized protein n=1 Tax=Bauhinia variegata TaxID=167791 RepID=A0ACB9KF31_BAUVA|nr:hypothetical protein L6164_035777 [Bauhinia variegata]